MDTGIILDYLYELRKNNKEKKSSDEDRAGAAKQVFETLLKEISEEIKKEGSQVTSEITDLGYRQDNKVKSAAFRACLRPKESSCPVVGFEIYLKPEGTFLGSGLLETIPKEKLEAVKRYLDSHREEFEDIIKERGFASYFNIRGREWLEEKNWYVQYPVGDAFVTDYSGFIKEVTELYTYSKPFLVFMNTACVTNC